MVRRHGVILVTRNVMLLRHHAPTTHMVKLIHRRVSITRLLGYIIFDWIANIAGAILVAVEFVRRDEHVGLIGPHPVVLRIQRETLAGLSAVETVVLASSDIVVSGLI